VRYLDVWFVLSVYLYKDVSLVSGEYIYIYICILVNYYGPVFFPCAVLPYVIFILRSTLVHNLFLVYLFMIYL